MIKIRKITEEDLEALAEMNAQLFKETTNQQALQVFEDSLKKGIREACLLAKENEEIIGAVFAEEKDTYYPTSANIKSIFVSEKWQGKRIGETLIEKCLDELKKAQIQYVTLSVDPKNKTAISLYEKYGFEVSRLIYMKRF